MAVSGCWCSGYRCCFAILLVLLLLMAPSVRAFVVPPEDASLAAEHTCRDVFMECQAGLANKACCTSINKKIADHRRWGHPCVCRQLRGKHCQLTAKCSKVFCPNCFPCARCSLEEGEGPIV